MPTTPFPWKYVNLIALVLFIGFNSLIRIKENQIYDDTRMQFANAQAWRQGYGVSLLYADPNDLAKVAPRVVEFWPPGYAVFAGTFLWLTGDVQLSGWLVDIMGLALFFVGWYLIARAVIPFTVPYFPALLMLPWGFGFMFKWLPTVDLTAVGWHVLGMGCLVQWVAGRENRYKFLWLVGSALAVFGACFFRFAYYPLTFVPAGLLLAGAVLGNRHWWRPALLLLVLTVGLVGAQILYQHFIARSVNYLTQRHATAGSVIHWYNLKQFTPFVTTSIPGASVLPFSEPVTDVLLLLALLGGSAGVARAARRLSVPARQVVYTWLGVVWLSFLLNIAFLVFLSLRYPPEAWGPWTYVQEIRYFGLNMSIASGVLLFLLFWKGSPVPRFVRYLLYGVAVVIFVHAYAFGSFKYRVNEPVTPSEAFATAAVVQQEVRNTPGRVVFATDQINDYWALIPMTSMGIFGAMGGAPIVRIDELVQSHPSSEPVTVLVAIVHTAPPGLEELYRQYGAKEVGTVWEYGARQVGVVGAGIPLMKFTLPATKSPTASRPQPYGQ